MKRVRPEGRSLLGAGKSQGSRAIAFDPVQQRYREALLAGISVVEAWTDGVSVRYVLHTPESRFIMGAVRETTEFELRCSGFVRVEFDTAERPAEVYVDES